MPASIGVNLRVTGHCRQGGRKYMEDFFSVAYQQTEDERDLEYAFFGIYDGHGGAEAAAFAKERLMETIVRHKYFWSDNDEDVLRSIKLGYIATHYAMWKEQEKWPKTASGLPSTAGTTASIAFIRRGKIYIGHVGDSAIVLGYQEPGCSIWKAKPLTRDHKPESAMEMSRIEQCGGKVVSKSGVPRVVWNRPRIGHKGPVRRSTPIDEIPFLAVARSLGDLWSYNSELDEFVVSPDPDCSVIPIDTTTFRCLIFGTDGLYNMLSPQMAVHIVQQAEKHNEEAALSDAPNKIWLNPSKCLVEKALKLWSTTKMRADNTSVVTLMLDPPGPPRAQVLRNRKKSYPDSGLQIVTRYQSEESSQSKEHVEPSPKMPNIPEHSPQILKATTSYRTPTSEEDKKTEEDTLENVSNSSTSDDKSNFVLKPRESLGFDPKCSSPDSKVPETVALQSKIEPKANKPELKSNKNIETKVHNLRSSESKSSDVDVHVSITERCVNCNKTNASDVSEVSTSSLDITTSESSIAYKSEENIQINEISSSSSELEEEETGGSGDDGNFSKTNLRRGKIRNSLRKVIKKPDKNEAKIVRNRKRPLPGPNELTNTKKPRNSSRNLNEEIKHNLRVRRMNQSEILLKKSEEMVNQIDSTNKELKQRLSPRKRERKPIDQNGISSNTNVFKKEKSKSLCPTDLTRKSQRLEQRDDRCKPKQKIKERLKEKFTDKFNKNQVATKVSKTLSLLRGGSGRLRKIKQSDEHTTITLHRSRSSIVSSSSKSSNLVKDAPSKSDAPHSKDKKVLVPPKLKPGKINQNRTLKMVYLGRLRRQVSKRNLRK